MIQSCNAIEAETINKADKLEVVLSGISSWDLLDNAKALVVFLEDCDKTHLVSVGIFDFKGSLPDIDRMEAIAKRFEMDILQFSSREKMTKARAIISEKIRQFNQRMEFLHKMVTNQDAAYGARYWFAKKELADLDILLAIMPDGFKKDLGTKLDKVKQKCFEFNSGLKNYDVVVQQWNDFV